MKIHNNENTPLQIKVCGMRNTVNIEQVADQKLNYLGYIFFAPSPRGVKFGDELFFPDNVIPVAVVVNESLEFIHELQSKYGFTHIQLHGKETPAFCLQCKDLGLTVFKAFSVSEESDFEQVKSYEGAIDFALYDTKGDKVGGNGVQFNWTLLQAHPLNVPFFLSGGIGEQDAVSVQEAFIQFPLMIGVDVNSKFEIEPGLKDEKAVGRFVRELRNNCTQRR